MILQVIKVRREHPTHRIMFFCFNHYYFLQAPSVSGSRPCSSHEHDVTSDDGELHAESQPPSAAPASAPSLVAAVDDSETSNNITMVSLSKHIMTTLSRTAAKQA